MQFQIIQPQSILSQYIKYYWTMESDPSEANVCERVVPIENVQLMFHFKKPFVVCHPNNIITQQSRSIISGLSNSYADVSTNGEAGVIAVSFHPAGACHFFNFPLSEIENQSINLADVFCKEIRQIEEQLYNLHNMAERIKIIENFLLKKFLNIPSYDYLLIQKGIDLIRKNAGQINAFSLSDKLSVTTKNLERKFARYLGKTPKQFIKLVRFQVILSEIKNDKPENLTDYAYKNGYFDQSHFIRDFKAFSGLTPKEFIAKYPCIDSNANSLLL